MWHNFGDGMRFGMVDPSWMFFAGLSKLFWFVFLIAAVFWLLRFFKRSRAAAWQSSSWQTNPQWREAKEKFRSTWKNWGSDEALQTARVRLAKGELTPEQYNDLKTQLEIAGEPDPALKIARQRLAGGEISLEEFNMIRNALQ